MTGFLVMARRCSTCIYRKDWVGTPLKALEDQCLDRWGFFGAYRACHQQPRRQKACCRGFWDHHKDEFQLGQLAQRLNFVEFIEPRKKV